MSNKNKYYDHIEERRFNVAYHLHLDYLHSYSKEFSYNLYSNKSLSINNIIPHRFISNKGNDVETELILNDINSYLIIGSPGTGKTTFVRKAIHDIINNEEKKYPYLPLLVNTKELYNLSLFNYLGNSLLRKEQFSKDEILTLLKNRKFILFIDGIDEVFGNKENLIHEINQFRKECKASKVILTSRPLISLGSLTGFNEIELYTPKANELFKNGIYETQFVNLIEKNNLNYLLLSPMVLKTLYDVYKHYGEIPTNRNQINKYVIDLILRDWDNSIKIDQGNEFGAERRFNLLSSLAYHLTFILKKDVLDINNGGLNSKIYSNFEPSISEALFLRTINEIESITGILIEVEHMKYSFAHKSIKDYLAAEYLVRLPRVPTNNFIEFPEIYAIAASLSSSMSQFEEYIFSELELSSIKISKEVREKYLNTLNEQRIN